VFYVLAKMSSCNLFCGGR